MQAPQGSRAPLFRIDPPLLFAPAVANRLEEYPSPAERSSCLHSFCSPLQGQESNHCAAAQAPAKTRACPSTAAFPPSGSAPATPSRGCVCHTFPPHCPGFRSHHISFPERCATFRDWGTTLPAYPAGIEPGSVRTPPLARRAAAGEDEAAAGVPAPSRTQKPARLGPSRPGTPGCGPGLPEWSHIPPLGARSPGPLHR
jgi:hypothetical protein